MPNFDDTLRTMLRNLAERAGPADFPAEPLVRRAARRRIRRATTTGLCALAVAAAVATPIALRSPRHYPAVTSPGPIGTGPWPTAFTCGQPLPASLPGSAGDRLRMVIGPVTRTASGSPAVTWYLDGTGEPGDIGPSIGADPAVVLIVRDDGTIIAAQHTQYSLIRARIPLDGWQVPLSEVILGQPRITACQPADWAPVWRHHQQYSVVILMSAWLAYFPNSQSARMPARFSATAALPPG